MMAVRREVSISFRWNTLTLFCICSHCWISQAFIPVSNVEKGLLPSGHWMEETSNNTNMIQEESRVEEQKDKTYTKYNYPFHPTPDYQGQPQGNPWSPSSLSTPPTPPPLYAVRITVQKPEAFVLQCHVEEPLEHISWLWFPCPNNYSPKDGVKIAEGTIVTNTSLYGVRIIGQFGVYISELVFLQNPLQEGIAGLYRCEAWPHGNGNQQTNLVYHDEFIIGGQALLNSCYNSVNQDKYFYATYKPTSFRKSQRSYRKPRNLTVVNINKNLVTEE